MSDDIVTVGAPLPRLSAASALDGRRVRLVWRSGDESVVDLAPALEVRRIYKRLRADDALFATLTVNEDGNGIEWEDGTDFSALWLRALPPADFSNADFREAMASLGQTLEGMALELGLSRRQVAYYAGEKPVPRHIGLAVRYLLERSGTRRNGQQTAFRRIG